MCCLRRGADAASGLKQFAGNHRIDAGHADVETSAEEVVAVISIQIDFGINRDSSRALDLFLGGDNFDGTHVAGRPGGTEQFHSPPKICCLSGTDFATSASRRNKHLTVVEGYRMRWICLVSALYFETLSTTAQDS